jgi:hypothetical protein
MDKAGSFVKATEIETELSQRGDSVSASSRTQVLEGLYPTLYHLTCESLPRFQFAHEKTVQISQGFRVGARISSHRPTDIEERLQP